MITDIVTLKAGDTPWHHGETGDLPGPWGATTEEAIATYERESCGKVIEHWLKGSTLWVVTSSVAEGIALLRRLSPNARETLAAVGVDAGEATADIAAAVEGQTEEELLALCLNGAERDDVIAGWHEYVAAVRAVAEKLR